MRHEGVEYRDGEAELAGLFIWDESVEGERPGVLVVHGGAGLDEHAKEQARRFAELGLLAFACDMYGETVAGDRDRVMAYVTELRDEPDKMVRRVRAAVETLASHRNFNGQLAGVGYCFGGLVVLELARSGAEISAVVSVHGSLATPRRARAGDIKTKVLVCHGALDPFVPAAELSEFIEEMNRAEADWQLIVYGGAMHGFTHRMGAPRPGVAYDAGADGRSFEAIKDFLSEALDLGPSPG